MLSLERAEHKHFLADTLLRLLSDIYIRKRGIWGIVFVDKRNYDLTYLTKPEAHNGFK